MLAYANVSSFSVIAELDSAISRSRQEKKNITVCVSGITVLVTPDSVRSKVVALWETEYEEKKNKK